MSDEAANSESDRLPNDVNIDGFEIIAELGRGGMARVYKARNKILDRIVAIKIIDSTLAADPKFVEKFKREALLCSQLKHPNIVEIFSQGTAANNAPFIVMEYIEGETLEALLQRQSTLTAEQFKPIISQLLEAIAFAHSKNIVHRDLKPSNIMCRKTSTGDNEIKVLDFGIAKSIIQGANNTQTLAHAGTPMYMSPEFWNHDADMYRCDVYSLACIMYQCISGQVPFAADSIMLTMYKRLKESMPSVSKWVGGKEFSRPLLAEIAKSLSRDPLQRAANAEILKQQIEFALDGSEVPAPKPMAAAIGLCLVLLVIAILLIPPKPTQKHSNESKEVSIQKKKLLSFNPKQLLQNASEKFGEDDYTGAIVEYRKILKHVPPGVDIDHDEWLFAAHEGCARNLEQLGRYKDALAELEAAATVYPQITAKRQLSALDLKCKYMSRHNELDKALKMEETHLSACEDYLKGDGNQNVGHAYLLHTKRLLSSGDEIKALSSAQKGLLQFDRCSNQRCSPEAVELTFLACDLLKKRHLDKQAAEQMNKLKRDLPLVEEQSAYAIREYAAQSWQRGLYDQAIAEYGRAIKVAEEMPKALSEKRAIIEDCKKQLAKIKNLAPPVDGANHK